MGGPTLLVGHSYGGAVISGAGHASNVVGLVYVAGFAPEEGESLQSILAGTVLPPGAASISPAFDDGFLWHSQDTFHDSFCSDLDDSESLVMATTQRPLARRCYHDHSRRAGVEDQAELVPGFDPGPHDPNGDQRWMAERIHRPAKPSSSTPATLFRHSATEVVELITNAADAV
jgi:pimeloyl-ACP methyl ester carboxylesterase